MPLSCQDASTATFGLQRLTNRGNPGRAPGGYLVSGGRGAHFEQDRDTGSQINGKEELNAAAAAMVGDHGLRHGYAAAAEIEAARLAESFSFYAEICRLGAGSVGAACGRLEVRGHWTVY